MTDPLFSLLGPMVMGDGPLSAKIIVVGEAPGHEEVRSGKPFIGGSGKLLETALASCKVSRGQVYFTNVCKQRPNDNDFSVFYADKQRTVPTDYLRESLVNLDRELSRFSPNVIIPVGDEALRAVTGLRGISKWRGSILRGKYGKTVPTLHPAFILRSFSDHPLFFSDIKKAVREAGSPNIRNDDYRFIVNPSFGEVVEWFRRLQDRLDSGAETRVSFDIETLGENIRCLGLGFERNVALCIPFIKFAQDDPNMGLRAGATFIPVVSMAGTGRFGSYWSTEEEYEVLKLCHKMFRDPRVKLIAQNCPFDMVRLQKTFGFTFANLWMDTMMAQHTCYAELPKGLDTLASLYTDIPYYSDHNASNDYENFVYNCWDVVATWQCSYALESELKQHHLWEFYRNHVNYVVESVISIENRGVRYDTEALRPIKDRFIVERDRLLGEIQTIAEKDDFNPGSFKQLQWFLYEKLRLPIQRHHKTKEITTDKNALDKLIRGFPQHRTIFELLKSHSEIRTLVNGFINRGWSSDGRMRTHFNSGGAVTRRLASSEPLFGDGSNLQNIPRRTKNGSLIRTLFVADPGWWLCKCDLSQAEFRLVAWLAKIGRIIQMYKDNPDFDVHTWVATLIYKIKAEAVQKAQRDLAKNGVYGGNYRMQPDRASVVYNMSLRDSTFILGEYRKAIPEIPHWWGDVEQQVKTTRCIIQPTGGKRFFFGHFNTETYLSAYSASAQTIVSDIINRAMVLAEELCDPSKFYIVLQVHDELVFHVRQDCLTEAAHTIQRIMEVPLYFPDIEEPLIIPADLSYGPNWQDQKKFNYKENPYVFPS